MRNSTCRSTLLWGQGSAVRSQRSEDKDLRRKTQIQRPKTQVRSPKTYNNPSIDASDRQPKFSTVAVINRDFTDVSLSTQGTNEDYRSVGFYDLFPLDVPPLR